MKVALINPPWTFEGSIYFGCRHPHLPLELGCSKVLLERAGHRVLLLDAHLEGLSYDELRARLRDFAPDMTVVTTAPTYLFWRCAQPELRVPQDCIASVRDVAGELVAVGPHGSTTPRSTLAKLDVSIVVMGECEETVVRLADGQRRGLPGTAYREDGTVCVNGGPQAARFVDLPALSWQDHWIRTKRHHHHRFERPEEGPGAEVEASRGCPFNCTFCAKQNFRDAYRRRELEQLLAEIDGLIAQGVRYLYFIDEIFLPNDALLHALVERPVDFGIQTRIDLWKPQDLAFLGRAGCVSMEAGVESLSAEGRAALAKKCKLSTEELAERLQFARRHIPFVQANLIERPEDDDAAVQRWRADLRRQGVWANDPVPLFPYPGSPDYGKLWGAPDDGAWERAHDYYLKQFDDFSDIQDERPLPLAALEHAAGH